MSWDEREIPFDLLVTVPLHGGAAFVERSPGLGDELGFITTDPYTLQAAAAPNVFAIGDATNVPTSKAGSVTHFEGETLVANVQHFLAGEPLEGSFDGHANCFIETGFHKALLIDFNYDAEPLPGRFPEPHVGPLPLLKESRLEPPRQVDVPVDLLARAASRARGPGHRLADADKGRSDTMTTMTILDSPVEVDGEGFLQQPEQWTEAMADEIARSAGIEPLTDRHWRSCGSCATGTSRRAPLRRSGRSGKASGVPDQGALPAVPEGPGEARREDRRHPQAPRLHLGRTARDDPDHRPAAHRGDRAGQDDR